MLKMSNIVLGKLDKLDLSTTITEVEVVEFIGNNLGETTFVSEVSEENVAAAKDSSADVYIPVSALSDHDINKVKVYFDVENYPFFQAAKKNIMKEAKPKGVFRFRRTVEQGQSDDIFASDLLVFSSLLGEVVDIKVKRTDVNVIPSHTIVMINFGGGTMAHVEYTVSDHERIELEWSGEKNIIEFDSNEMRPIQPASETRLPLVYSVDTILETAHSVDQKLIDTFDYFKKLLSGGACK